VGQLSERIRIYACCTRCERMAPLTTRDLVIRFGADFTVAAVRERVRCRQCGTRTGEIRLLYQLPPGPLIRR
jgi:hypothetical protein